jgi:hypothetical protein
MDKARAHLERARKVADASEVTEREKLYVDAFYSWMAGDLPRAYADFKRVPPPLPLRVVSCRAGVCRVVSCWCVSCRVWC